MDGYIVHVKMDIPYHLILLNVYLHQEMFVMEDMSTNLMVTNGVH